MSEIYFDSENEYLSDSPRIDEEDSSPRISDQSGGSSPTASHVPVSVGDPIHLVDEGETLEMGEEAHGRVQRASSSADASASSSLEMSNHFAKSFKSPNTSAPSLPKGPAPVPADNSKGSGSAAASSQPPKKRVDDPASSEAAKKLKVLMVRESGKDLLKFLSRKPRVKEDLELLNGAQISTNLQSAQDHLFRVTY